MDVSTKIVLIMELAFNIIMIIAALSAFVMFVDFLREKQKDRKFDHLFAEKSNKFTKNAVKLSESMKKLNKPAQNTGHSFKKLKQSFSKISHGRL